MIGIREKAEHPAGHRWALIASGCLAKLGAAPRAIVDRDRLVITAAPGQHAGAGTVVVAISFMAELIGGAALPHPQADLEGPLAEQLGILAALQLQCADQGRGAAELVEGEQAEGVAHQHAHAGRLDRPPVAQPAQHQGVSRQTQVSLGFAAAGGKEQEVNGVAIGIRGIGHPNEVHQQEGELERTPAGLHDFRLFAPHHPEPLTGSGSHHAVGDRKGKPHLFVLQRFDATLDAPGLLAGLLQELRGGGLLLLAGRVCRRALLLDPVRVGLHEGA